MPSFAENRRQLPAANVLLYIGGIPAVHEADVNFQPHVSNYGLYQTFYTMSGVLNLSDCDKVNDAAGDSAISGKLIPVFGTPGEVVTINDGALRVSRPDVLFLRNCFQGQARTFLDVLSFDTNAYDIDILPYGARLDLKWGDVLVVKPTRENFHTTSASSPALDQLFDVEEKWGVYVCLPEFQSSGPYNALQIPGVCRQIRERVELFVTVWDSSWDAVLDRVVFTRDGPRQQLYAAKKYHLLEQHTGGVKLIADDVDLVEFSSMVVAEGDDTPPPVEKRALDEEDRADCKRAKH